MTDIYSATEVYHVLETVGRGTFGKVAKCWRGRDGELVAVKIMDTDANKSRVIKNELKLISAICTANLDKSHIVQFYEAFPGQNCHFLVFELLEKNLYQLQQENRFKPLATRDIRTITYQVLKALAKLKELGIIHADLKPENIMVVDQNRHPFRVKVIDFGSASLFHEVRFVREPYIQSRFYRSPEILLGLPFCEKVDMWSLGCIISELCIGWPLYPGESEYDQVRYICETQGIPGTHLLNSASKAHLYFQLTKPIGRGAPQWELKAPSGIAKDGLKKTESSKTEGSTERRRFIFKSLDGLKDAIPDAPRAGKRFRNEEAAAEICDKCVMVELVKRMLTVDSHQRINPSSALRHQFITMHHLRHDHPHYYDMSLGCLQEAVHPARTSGGDSARPRPRPQAEAQPHQPQPPHHPHPQPQPQPQLHPRPAYQPQRGPAVKQGPLYQSGSCQAAFTRKPCAGSGGLASSGAQSQHNLVHSQVQKTAQQLDDLSIVDEQDMTYETASEPSEESDQGSHSDSEEEANSTSRPESKGGADEEEGAAAAAGPRRERSFGESILSYFTSLCNKQPMAATKVPDAQSDATSADVNASGPTGRVQDQDVALDVGSSWVELGLSSLDSTEELEDTNPPQDFLAETLEDFSGDDMMTENLVNQILSSAEVEDEDDVTMTMASQNLVGLGAHQGLNSGAAGYEQYRHQATQAGGEYVLQYIPYQAEVQPYQWSDGNAWMAEGQVPPFHTYGQSARAGNGSQDFLRY